jgi:hypothetical protein
LATGAAGLGFGSNAGGADGSVVNVDEFGAGDGLTDDGTAAFLDGDDVNFFGVACVQGGFGCS